MSAQAIFARRGNNSNRFEEFSSEGQGQDLALTVLCVPYSCDGTSSSSRHHIHARHALSYPLTLSALSGILYCREHSNAPRRHPTRAPVSFVSAVNKFLLGSTLARHFGVKCSIPRRPFVGVSQPRSWTLPRTWSHLLRTAVKS